MNKHTIQLDLNAVSFDRRERIPETMRYRVNNQALDDLLGEIEDAFWVDHGAGQCHTNPKRISVGMSEVMELICWAARQLSGVNAALWDGAKAQTYRWDRHVDAKHTHASVVAVIREGHEWKVTHVAYLTPEQFQKALANGDVGRRDPSTMRLGELSTIIFTLDHIPTLLSSVLQKRKGAIAYDKNHPAVNKLMNQQHKKRVIPKGREDTDRLDWLLECLRHDAPDLDLRKYIDSHRAKNVQPHLQLTHGSQTLGLKASKS